MQEHADATIKPNKKSAPYHKAKMQIHRALYEDQKKYDALVAGVR